jgi:uncharacterized protein YggE
MKFFNVTVLSFLLVVAPWVIADSGLKGPHIVVSGSGKIQVKPDTVRIEFQAIAVENDADNAKQVVDNQVQLLLSKIQENGFEEILLTRGDIELHPEFELIEKKNTQVGIKATRNLSYQLNDLSKTNLFFQMLVEAEISNIGQIHYALKDPLQWQEKARDLAVEDSIRKAKGLAKSYKVDLGKIYSINYQSNNIRPVMMRAMENDDMGTLYQNHMITLSERVDAVFLLDY